MQAKADERTAVQQNGSRPTVPSGAVKHNVMRHYFAVHSNTIPPLMQQSQMARSSGKTCPTHQQTIESYDAGVEYCLLQVLTHYSNSRRRHAFAIAYNHVADHKPLV
jgi:hypothetical protein